MTDTANNTMNGVANHKYDHYYTNDENILLADVTATTTPCNQPTASSSKTMRVLPLSLVMIGVMTTILILTIVTHFSNQSPPLVESSSNNYNYYYDDANDHSISPSSSSSSLLSIMDNHNNNKNQQDRYLKRMRRKPSPPSTSTAKTTMTDEKDNSSSSSSSSTTKEEEEASSSSSSKKKQKHEHHRIVGGEATMDPTKYPWMVALYDNFRSKRPICGGSLITPSIIMTAAHCASSIRAAEVYRYDLKDEYNTADDGIIRQSIQPFLFDNDNTNNNVGIMVHPLYNSRTFDNDIALLKLSTPIPNPKLVGLHRTPEIPPQLKVLGWGRTSYDGDRTDVLHETSVNYVSEQDCNHAYGSSLLSDHMICAASPGKDSCQGDSGGPLVIEGRNIQVGVVSWGFGCAHPRYPGVYASIPMLYNWIESTICNTMNPSDCSSGLYEYSKKVLPTIDAQGQRKYPNCQDAKVFLGLGTQMRIRDCNWVGERPDRRCRWYGNRYCPETCQIERCRFSS